MIIHRSIIFLFSAYAEVFLDRVALDWLILTFLCLRRGVSRRVIKWVPACPLFSAYAEVFRWRRRADGGRRFFSLPTQRCFYCAIARDYGERLFSAYAEVFPIQYLSSEADDCFSLPTQRCFYPSPLGRLKIPLFSAYAEVFPL